MTLKRQMGKDCDQCLATALNCHPTESHKQHFVALFTERAVPYSNLGNLSQRKQQMLM